jgi:hypothetical protein
MIYTPTMNIMRVLIMSVGGGAALVGFVAGAPWAIIAGIVVVLLGAVAK